MEDGLEQRDEVRPDGVRRGAGPSGAGVGVQHGEAHLVFVGVEVEEELLDLVDDLGDAGVGSVDLVHDDHDRQARLERLAQHEARLRQRALGGVDQEEDAVHHRQGPLHLPAEVGVPRSVHDGDLHRAVRHGRVLGENGDALFALEVARVEHPVGELLVGPEGPGLAEHGVDQRRLAVIDVCHDGYIAKVVTYGHGPTRLVARVDARSPQRLEWSGLGLPLAPTLILGFRSRHFGLLKSCARRSRRTGHAIFSQAAVTAATDRLEEPDPSRPAQGLHAVQGPGQSTSTTRTPACSAAS